jgi:transposase
LCDRGYDADWWRERLLAAGHHPVVPGRRTAAPSLSTTTPTEHDTSPENTFASLKSSRRICTRYDHTTTAFAAFVSLACVFH